MEHSQKNSRNQGTALVQRPLHLGIWLEPIQTDIWGSYA